LSRELRRQGERQLGGQLQLGEANLRKPGRAGRPAYVYSKPVAQLIELALKLGQRGPGLGKIAPRGDHVGLGRCPELLEAPGDGELARLEGDDLPGGRELLAQRRFPDRGGDDVAGQHQARRLELEALVVHFGAQRLELPPRGPEEIEGVGHADRGEVEIEGCLDRQVLHP
jgi:hypothetical protein